MPKIINKPSKITNMNQNTQHLQPNQSQSLKKPKQKQLIW